MSSTGRSLFGYLLLGSFVTACGPAPGSFLSSTDPCTLITLEEAAQALAEPAKPGTASDSTTCVFTSVRNDAHAVTVQVDETSGKDRRAWFNKERLRRDSVLISGLGDGAVRIDSPPSLSRVSFLRGDSLVTVMVSTTGRTDLANAAMVVARSAAERYGATVAPLDPTSTTTQVAGARPVGQTASITARTVAPVADTQSRSVPASDPAGPVKSTTQDQTALIGTWRTHIMQGTTKHEFLLVIDGTKHWTLSSLMQFEGVLDAQAGRWSLDRANTFKGQSWKGTYLSTTPTAFSTTGSVHADWSKLEADQIPTGIPAELWNLRREATSVPVFQLKAVDQALIGTWQGTGTYAGGPATFVWSIKPSAATDLFIMDTTRGTVLMKNGVPQLQPVQKRQRSLGIVSIQDDGLTTNDGKTTLRWTRVDPTPAANESL
jgi:hypothetical protein